MAKGKYGGGKHNNQGGSGKAKAGGHNTRS